MNVKMADADENDVESLIEINSSPDLCHNREEANWFAKSFFDYHRIKLLQYEGKIIGALFWNAKEEKPPQAG